ncbi:hypothetical protein CTI12_AA010730 [Artemisia annua]|uniref:Helitron helicase-like domain-containing protein n=1 Tax=Artemisia annua TaxID=35608 RepID=A0A2U1QAU7_ARTAN|nr:hypothetical protein CTI12_AA010730 [Artemisia annua]
MYGPYETCPSSTPLSLRFLPNFENLWKICYKVHVPSQVARVQELQPQRRQEYFEESMKTKKKAIRRITSLPPLESIELSGFDQEVESHGLHLQPETMVSGLGSLDPFLSSVSEASCKARLGANHSCTGTGYREEAMTESIREDGTFNVNYECGYTSVVFVDQPSQSTPHTAHVCTSTAVQTTDGCNVQGSRARSLSNLDGSRTSMDKGKRKMSDLSNEDTFRSGRVDLATLSEASEAELQCGEDFFLIDGDERRVIPEHLSNTSTSCGVGPSSHETSQNSGTPTNDCNVELPRNNRQRRSQVRIGSSSNRTQVPHHVRNRNRRSRQEHFQRTGQALRPDIVENLIELLDEHNQLMQLFRTARDKMAEANIPEFKVRLFGVVGSRQHELPAGDSIGAIVFEGGPDVETEFDVVVEQNDRQLKQVSKLNASYMSMQFPLLFFFGEDGYHLGRVLLSRGTSSDPPKKNVNENVLCIRAARPFQ